MCASDLVNSDSTLNIFDVQANPNFTDVKPGCHHSDLKKMLNYFFKKSLPEHLEAVLKQTHSSSSTSLPDTPHSHIWLMKHDSMLLLLIPFTGWYTSPPTHIIPRRAPLSSKRWSRDEAANRSGLFCPNMFICNSLGALLL